MAKLHRSEFLAELKAAFPSIAEDLNAEHGLLHLETAVFRRFTQHAIDNGDRDVVVKCFSIAEKYYAMGNGKLQNALGVSYVEDLVFLDQRTPRQWAWVLLPTSLKTAYEVLRGGQNA
jgi:hypothetical protein